MYTHLLSIQRLEADTGVQVYELNAENIRWTCVVKDEPRPGDGGYFPIRATGQFEIIHENASAETDFVLDEHHHVFNFRDVYFGKEGTVFIVILPQGFIPDVISFIDDPILGVNLQGTVFSEVPGSLKVAYNHVIKRSVAVIQLYKTVGFEMAIRGKKVKDKKFPVSSSLRQVNSIFDISLSREFLGVDHITNEDLKIVNETLATFNLDELKEALESLLSSAKARDEKSAGSAINKIRYSLVGMLANSSSLTTLIDSYSNSQGAAHLFITQALKISKPFFD